MAETIDLPNTELVQISEQAAQQSESFIGQWNTLISTTNWEKGEIICQWRASLEESGAQASEYSDEAWSQLVGGVSPQHTGRLRRTWQRFGHVYREYAGLFWSHFYAAIDWDDAEMWLEGAVQNRWSVSKMRHQRWETLGQLPDQEPQPKDIISSELNEESGSLELAESKRQNDRDYVEGPVHEGPDFGDESAAPSTRHEIQGVAETADTDLGGPVIRPFESFTNLPDDIEEVVQSLKVAIIRHKAAGWEEMSRVDMIALLEALKRLAD